MWRGPASVTSTSSDFVAWSTTGNLYTQDFDQVKTVIPLTSVSVNLSGSTSSVDNNPPTPTEVRDEMKITRSAPLVLTDFGFNSSGTILGIELEIVGQRNNRISDWDIRLVHLGDKIGTNHSVKIERNSQDQPNYVPNTQRYGTSTDTWGADLTSTVVNSASFGVSIELVSHPITPHSDTAYIDSVLMRVFT